ncbi:MAG: hypothetical protein U9O87_01715 [Verrucomicrobiota bacterium]|nr:hypothetical protein [Verrucomicrobiota bacterium]
MKVLYPERNILKVSQGLYKNGVKISIIGLFDGPTQKNNRYKIFRYYNECFCEDEELKKVFVEFIYKNMTGISINSWIKICGTINQKKMPKEKQFFMNVEKIVHVDSPLKLVLHKKTISKTRNYKNR